jgi:hypothetical protein
MVAFDKALCAALGIGRTNVPSDPQRVKEVMLEQARTCLGGDTRDFRLFENRFVNSQTINALLRGDSSARILLFPVLWGLMRGLLRPGDFPEISRKQLNHLGRAVHILYDWGEVDLAREVERVREKSAEKARSGPPPSAKTKLVRHLEYVLNADGKIDHSLLAKSARRKLITDLATEFVSKTTKTQVRDILKDARRYGDAR